MSNTRHRSQASAVDLAMANAAEGGCWRLADGVLFGVVSSLVLWSLIVAGLYGALI